MVKQVKIDPPNLGPEIGVSFDPAQFDNFYNGQLLVNYKGTKKTHRPCAHFLSTDSESNQYFVVDLTQGGQPAGDIINLPQHGLHNPQPGDWYEPDEDVTLPMVYAILCTSVPPGGSSGWDSGLRISGRSYQNGIKLHLACDDYGSPGDHVPPDADYNDKIVEVFFPLDYGTDYLQVTLTPAYRNQPPQVIIS